MRSFLSILLISLVSLFLLAADHVAPEKLNSSFAKIPVEAELELLVNRYLSDHGLPLQNHRVALDEETRKSDTENSTVVIFDNGIQLEMTKVSNQWNIKNKQLSSSLTHQHPQSNSEPTLYGGFSVGQTFIPIPISKDHSIDRLTRSVTKTKLNRRLFSVPDKTVSYFKIEYFSDAPFVKSTYIKLVVDSEWNRILYGNLNHWIKSYDNLAGPFAIEVDPTGRVFVGEAGKKRILVLQISGDGEQAKLEYQFEIPGIENPADIAHHDSGTPFDISDDKLYIADPTQNEIHKISVDESGYSTINDFSGFDSPTTIQTGKWNGLSDDHIYVIDNIGKRVRLFEDSGSDLVLRKEITGDYDQYFQDLKTDHFGNVYLIDHIHSKLFKYSSDLELLDETGGTDAFNGLANLDIPFGKVTLEGEQPKWVGFDQLIAAERWTETSGARRLQLGLGLKNITFQTDSDISHLITGLTLTDAGDVCIRIFDQNERMIRIIEPGWQTPGRKQIPWSRREENGSQVAAGHYRVEIKATSAYRDETITQNTQLYLPMYYWENCGSSNSLDDPHLIQGKAVTWGESATLTANEHPSTVRYLFNGLNPESDYQLAAEFYSGDGVSRHQDIGADGFTISRISFSNKPVKTKYMEIPQKAYEDGQVTISFSNNGSESAIVSQLWFKETDATLNLKPLKEGEEILSDHFVLRQNYPNPFNPETTIKFQTSEPGKVNLAVYDILGRKVRTLVNETLQAGSHSIIWNGTNEAGQSLASGIYFYRMQFQGHVQTKRMVLLK